jgi:hypothetical protein
MMISLSRVVAASLVLAAAACAPSPANAPETHVYVGEATELPYAPGGGITTIELRNDGVVPVTFTGLTFEADQGLTVSYLGWTDCVGGCVGTGHWADDSTKELEQKSVKGVFPVVVPPDRALVEGTASPVGLVLRLDMAPSAEPTLNEHCLGTHSAIVTLPSGRKFTLRTEGAIAGLLTSLNPNPPGYRRCLT